MVQQSYLCHPSFRHTIQREIAALSFVLMGDGAVKLSPSSAIPPHNTMRNRSTIIRFDGRWCSKVIPVIRHSTTQYNAKLRCHHLFWWGDGARKLPPWGLYLFKIPAQFPHHPHFCECVNHDDEMPWMVTCNAFDSAKKDSTTPKGVASLTPCAPG